MIHLTLERAREFLLDILFPEICASCSHPLENESKDRGICPDCFALVDIKTAFTCPVCGTRFAEGKKTCHQNTPYLLAATSSYSNEIIRGFIHELKYGHRTAYGRPLAAMIAIHLENLHLDFSDYSILPVPLHRSRERNRGFNQSAVIAEFLSEMTNIPLAPPDTLLRFRNTKPQAELSREDRLTNILGSFIIKTGTAIPKNILLLDDVCTSGATLKEAASVLKAAGVRNVIGVVAAKA